MTELGKSLIKEGIEEGKKKKAIESFHFRSWQLFRSNFTDSGYS